MTDKLRECVEVLRDANSGWVNFGKGDNRRVNEALSLAIRILERLEKVDTEKVKEALYFASLMDNSGEYQNYWSKYGVTLLSLASIVE